VWSRWDGGVPEYDAFGRRIGEDPLEGLRAPTPPAAPATTQRPAARPEAMDVVERVPAPPAPPRRGRAMGLRGAWAARPRGGRRGGGLAGWLVILAFLGAALAGVGVVDTSVDGGSEGVTTGPAIDPAAPGTGVNGTSLIRESNFAEAVDALSRAGLGRPLTMRVAPDRIDATLLDKTRVHHVRITPGGELTELATTAASAGSSATVAYAKIDVSAPRRLVRAGATRRNPARRIDYLVLTPGPPITWGAYFKGGRIVVGDAHGRKQRVI
jgi:hypothetical protein